MTDIPPPGRDSHFSLGVAEAQPEQMSLDFGQQKPSGVSFLRAGARRYAARQGLGYSSEHLGEMQSDRQFQTRVARAYQETPGGGVRTQRAYEALAHEVGLQHDYLTRPRTQGGLGVNVEVTDHDPYRNRDELVDDVQRNRRLRVLSTASTGSHPFFTDEQNDQFRAVHDAFGHAAIGRSFSRHGEEAAYHSHMQMFTPLARPALAAETRGQNSTFIYKNAGQQFPEQRLVAMPDWATQSRVPGIR